MKFSRPFLETTAWFTALGLLAFFAVLFLGQCYDANDLLYQFAPWRHFLRASIAQGILPLWNPYSFCGQPFLADLQSQILYPPNWPTLLPSVPTGMGWFTVLHWGLAAFGMRLWLRRLDLHEGAARLGGLLFAFSGFFWWEIIHPPVFAAFAWLPWWFAALEGLIRRPSIRTGWAAGAAFAMLFLAGSFQVSLGAAYGGVLYAAGRLWLGWPAGEKRPPFTFRLSSRLLVGAFLGASLLLFQLAATQTFSRLSVRENAGKVYEQFNGYWSLQPSTLGQYLLPRLGLPAGQTIETAIQEVTGDGGQKPSNENIGNDYLANFGYLGIWIPLLAYFAFREKHRSLAVLLASLAGLSLLVCFGKYLFLHKLLCDLVPGFSLLRAAFRFQYLYILFMSALAALGYQALTREGVAQEELRLRRTLIAAYAVLGLLFCLINPGQCWREMLALGVGGAGWWWAGTPSFGRLGRSLAAFALVGPLLLSGWGDFAVHPAGNLDLEKNAPWLDQVRAKAGNDRLWLDSNLAILSETDKGPSQVAAPANAACVWGLKIASGYNPLQLKSFAEIQSLPFPVFSKLTALHWLFMSKKQEIPGYRLTDDNVPYSYETIENRPAAYAPSHWSVEADSRDRLNRMSNPAFDPYSTSFLDAPPAHGASLPDFSTPPVFTPVLQSETPNRQIWRTEASADLLAVFSDAFYPGWRAFVDGNEVPVQEANHAYRAVALPAGSHEVEFRFEPFGSKFITSFLILWSLAGLLLWFFTRPQPGRAKES